jgi:hypothetical protein
MKMISSLLNELELVALLRPMAMFIFLGLFIIVAIRIIRMKKEYAEEMSRFPLDEGDKDNVIE